MKPVLNKSHYISWKGKLVIPFDFCGMIDLESKGCAFTWSNNRERANLVKKRLDRAVCDLDWRTTFPLAEAFALPAISSDHSPILLCLSTENVFLSLNPFG